MKYCACCLFLVALLTGLSRPNVAHHSFLAMSLRSKQVLAGLNLNRPRLEVTDFGADPTGGAASDVSIRNAIAACDPAVGCEIHFPAGSYKLSSPLSSSCGQSVAVEFCLPNAPITLSGDGPNASILVPVSGSDIFVGPTPGATGLNGLTIHDIGFALATPNQATAGSDIVIPDVNVAVLYNLYFSGANNAITLGANDGASTAHTSNVYMDSLTSLYSNGLMLARFRGDFLAYSEGLHHGQATTSPGLPARISA